jgi:hypothetical protein
MQNANAAAVELPDADLEAVAGGKAVGKQQPAPAQAQKAGGHVHAAPAAWQRPVGGCPGGVCPM